MAKSFKNNVNWSTVWEAEQRAKKQALWAQGQAVITQADKDKLVPIETGTLRRSSVVTLENLPDPQAVYNEAESLKGNKKAKSDDPKSGPKDVSKAWASYNTPYAEHLHEDLNWQPRAYRVTASGKVVPKPAEGGPKWLEKALARCKDKFADILARAMQKEGF